ncbi:MAG: TIGR02757 family protein [Bacteroidota bacterium]|jgi:uncharacterized protein (TIGR02757 family)
MKKNKEIFELLELKYHQFNRISFIENDPISIPHRFSKKEDIELSAFFASTLAWGQRITIIKNSEKLISWMDNSPHDFILNHTKKDLQKFGKFCHRTFNGQDCLFFIKRLALLYKKYGGLEKSFSIGLRTESETIENAIINFRKAFFGNEKNNRSFKHVSNPEKNSSSKRICMFLRWMVRHDKNGCDFGIWKKIKPSQLCLPLDVHTGNSARKLGLLKRNQNDWKAVIEITDELKKFDPDDPVKYDFALFGMGVNCELIK